MYRQSIIHFEHFNGQDSWLLLNESRPLTTTDDEWRMKTDNILAILCSFSKKVYNHSIYSRVSIQTLHTSSSIIIISSLFIRCLHVYWYLLFDYFSNPHVIVLRDGADPIRQSLITWRRTDWNDVEVAKIFW